MLHSAIAIANGKGGVGKTSLTANIAAIAAHSGWRVLVVDVDMQANLGLDLGYKQRGESDDGRALSDAVQGGNPVAPPIRNIRPNLDAIPAGHLTRDLEAVIAYRRFSNATEVHALERALAPIAHEYDLILFDCPPSGASIMSDLALAAARGLVIPVKFDGGSLDGLEVMATRFAEIKGGGVNPGLELLGIVLFDFARGETAILAEVEAQLRRDFEHGVTVFQPPIRRSARAAVDMRRDGVVAIEYERAANEDRQHRLRLLREGVAKLRGIGPAKSQSAPGLADDYMAVTHEILAAFGAEPEAETDHAAPVAVGA